MESSRRDLLNDVAEHRSSLKNDQNTYYPRFSFTPKTGIAFPKTGVLFFCEGKSNRVWLGWVGFRERRFDNFVKHSYAVPDSNLGRIFHSYLIVIRGNVNLTVFLRNYCPAMPFGNIKIPCELRAPEDFLI